MSVTPQRKRNRALITQDEPAFNRQAATAETDLVGDEQLLLDGDRNTSGVKTRSSPWPGVVGAFRGKAVDNDYIIKQICKSIAPPVRYKLFLNDFKVNQNIGGHQMVWDSERTLSRSSTAGGTLGDDSWVSAFNRTMDITSMTTFRNVYRKMAEGASLRLAQQTTITTTDVTETALPGLTLTGYTTSKLFTNTGTNTIVVELWDCLCSEDTDLSPCMAWAEDIGAKFGPIGLQNSNTINPLNSESTRSWGDPGVRPHGKLDKNFYTFWEPIRKTRYLLRAGQTITHMVTLPSTTLSHNQLYQVNADGTAAESFAYKRNVSINMMGFALGEICYNTAAGHQVMGTSSVYLTGRGNWDFTARSAPYTRTEFSLLGAWRLETDIANKSELFPQIANNLQGIIGQPVSEQFVTDLGNA